MATALDQALSSAPPVDASQLQPPANDAAKKPTSSIADAIAPDIKDVKDKMAKASSIDPPPPPQFKEAPKFEESDPSGKGYISAIGIAGAIGSMFTRRPMVNSMNAAAAAVGALKQGDLETYKQKMETWKIDNENIKNLANYQSEMYKDALEKAKTDLEGGMALLQAHAASFKDDAMLQLAKNRDLREAGDYKTAQDKAVYDLAEKKDEFEKRGEAKKAATMVKQTYDEDVKVMQADMEEDKKALLDTFKDKQNLTKVDQEAYQKGLRDLEQKYKHKAKDLTMQAQRDLQAIADPKIGAAQAKTASTGRVTLSPESIAQKVEILHKGGSYSDAGISQRSNNNPNKDAVDDALAEKYPDFNREDAIVNLAGQKQEQKTESAQAGKVVSAANSLDEALPLLKAAAAKVDLKSFTTLNAAENYYREHTSDKNMEEFLLAVQTAITDYSTLIARNGLRTDSTDRAAKDLLNSNMGKGSIAGFIEQAEKEKAAQLRATAKTTGRGDKSESPPVPGAKKAPDGNWYVDDPKRPGKYLKVEQ